MKTIARPTTYRLAEAITDMAMRYAEASREGALAYARVLDGKGSREQYARWDRARIRRLMALMRLTEALRQRAGA